MPKCFFKPSVTTYTNAFKTDLLFRTIYFASLYNITFDHLALPASTSSVVPANPIQDYFKDNPRLFAKVLYQLKKHNIRSFSQCISDDGLALLPHAEIMARQKTSTLTKSFRVPAWYTHLKNTTTMTGQSYRLKAEYVVNDVKSLPIPSHIILTTPETNDLFWLAQWHEPSQTMIFGRTISIDTNRLATVAHWIQVQAPTAKDKTTDLTPKSSNMSLSLCQGCELDDHRIPRKHRKHIRQGPFSCALQIHLNQAHCIEDGPSKVFKGTAHFRRPYHYYAGIARRLLQTPQQQPVPPPLYSPGTPVPNEQGDETLVELRKTYSSQAIIDKLLPLANRLKEDPLSQHWLFYTDGAYSRTPNHSTVHNNGSGFLASYDDTHEVPGFALSFSNTHWPSAYKAEVMAFFTLLSVLPNNFTCTIRVDCQALISTYHNVIYNITPS